MASCMILSIKFRKGNKMTNANDIIYFRLRDELDRDKLKELAEKENRSVSNMVETILIEYLRYKNI